MLVNNKDELKIGELPELNILAIGDVLFHEEPDIERVAKLIDRFSADGMLKNPPVVAKVDGNSSRILLDGANRITALIKLEFRDVLVQEIELSDPSLIISQWHHAVEYLTKQEIITHIDDIPGITRKEWLGDADADDPDFLCRIEFTDETGNALFGAGDFFSKVDQLRQFTDIYHKLAYMDRVSYTNLAHLKKNYLNLSALVSFRNFTKDEVLAISGVGKRVPSGITRVMLPKRALNFNLHLDILKSNLSLEEKNDWLHETIRHKIFNKSIRFYREPTFFFDE